MPAPAGQGPRGAASAGDQRATPPPARSARRCPHGPSSGTARCRSSPRGWAAAAPRGPALRGAAWWRSSRGRRRRRSSGCAPTCTGRPPTGTRSPEAGTASFLGSGSSTGDRSGSGPARPRSVPSQGPRPFRSRARQPGRCRGSGGSAAPPPGVWRTAACRTGRVVGTLRTPVWGCCRGLEGSRILRWTRASLAEDSHRSWGAPMVIWDLMAILPVEGQRSMGEGQHLFSLQFFRVSGFGGAPGWPHSLAPRGTPTG